MSRIEFKNGSIIKPIESDSNVRSKRGKKQLESAWTILEDYYNSLPWYKKIITRIRWFFGDIYVWLLCIYYKNKKVEED